jgi:hypothetical protein
MQALLGWLGAAAPILIWVTWGIGAFVLVLLALALSLLVVLIRKTMPPTQPPQPPQSPLDPSRQPPPAAAA